MSTLALILLAIVSSAFGQTEFHSAPNIVAVDHLLEAPFSSSLNNLRSNVGLCANFSLNVEQESEPVGAFVRQRLRISYNDVPLRIARLQASAKISNGKYKGIVNGFYPRAIPATFDTTLTLTDIQIKTAVVDYINANDSVPAEIIGGVSGCDLIDFQYEKQIDIDAVTGDVNLVYAFRCKIDAPLSNGVYIRYPRGLIDVATGQAYKVNLIVLKASSNNNNACPKAQGGNLELPGNTYGPGPNKVCLNARKVGKRCFYENEHVKIFDAKNSFDRSGARVKSFKCKKGPDDEINGAFSPSSDAFYYSQRFYDMLYSWTGMSNINREPIGLFVHFGDQYPNSFYDGECLSFGDGTALAFPLTIGETIGHELGHALIGGFNSIELGLESVALNEAVSDILGKGVTVFDTNVLDWRFAQGFFRGVDALRYFNDPPLDGIAIDNMSDFDTNLDVYALMGVYLKFMFELVDTQYVPYRDGVQAIVFAAEIYWNEETSFIDASCGIMRAARDLSQNTSSYQAAFSAVGIDVSFCSL